MGLSHSYLNLWALSSITFSNFDEIISIIEDFEIKHSIVNDKETFIRPSKAYFINETNLSDLLSVHKFHQSDSTNIINIYRILDDRGDNLVSLIDVMITFSTLTANSVEACIENSLKLFDRGNTKLIEKNDLMHVFRLLNNSFFYFGDKFLAADQLSDLLDSVYTSSGKIDGTIYYPDNIEYISSHPVVQIFLSPQYQGAIKEKILDEETIEKIANSLK